MFICWLTTPACTSTSTDEADSSFESGACNARCCGPRGSGRVSCEPLLSLRCFAGGQIYLDVPHGGGRGDGRTTHRATSTHLTGSISKQRMPEQKNHTPDHPKGAHVTNTPPAPPGARETPQVAIFSLPTL